MRLKMSFVPAKSKVDEKTDKVIDCVNCPVKALIKDGSTYYCTHNFSVSKNTIAKTSLGDVPLDVIKTCESCSLHKPKTESVERPLVSTGCLNCPMLKASTAIKDCAKCPCLDEKATVKHLLTMSKDSEVDKVYCMYPNVSFKDVSVKFTPSKRKIVKEKMGVIRSILKKKG